MSTNPTLVELPSWMAPAPAVPSAPVPLAAIKRENEEAIYPALFERALDTIAQGKPLTQAFEEYPIAVPIDRFRRWVHADDTRLGRYREAQEIGAEVLEAQMLDIADGDDTVEDVARSTLRINTRKWLMGVWNRKRFGEIKQIEQNVTIDMGRAMAEAQARVDAARTVDTTSRIVND